jgi:iron-sulfur cluster assembly protein
MISVTPAAAQQIRESAKQGNTQGMPLRVAVTRLEDGSFHYAVGFDDTSRQGDNRYSCEGIEIVVAPQSLPLLEGTVIDYVDIEGNKEIVFINPNDPLQSQPEG